MINTTNLARTDPILYVMEDVHWIDRDSIAGAALPSVMRKVVAHALSASPVLL